MMTVPVGIGEPLSVTVGDVRVCRCTARVRAFWCRRGRVRVHVHDYLVTHGGRLRVRCASVRVRSG